ncbi:MAG: hypothetical protein ACK5LK_09080, partial [Chthoniobacterales bacterium]
MSNFGQKISSLYGGIFFASFFCLFPQAEADVVPAPLFTDRAVLQQGKPLPVWGKADPSEAVRVTYKSSTLVREASTVAGENGEWKVVLDSLPASTESATLTFAGKNTVERKDILVGEVWLAAGQSNMDTALFWTKAGK